MNVADTGFNLLVLFNVLPDVLDVLDVVDSFNGLVAMETGCGFIGCGVIILITFLLFFGVDS